MGYNSDHSVEEFEEEGNQGINKRKNADSSTVGVGDQSQSVQGEPTSSVQDKPPSKMAKKCTSEVWKYFTKIGMVEGKEKARCNGCNKEYVVGGKEYGTSTLRRHINTCGLVPKFKDLGVMMLDQKGNVRSRQIDHNKVREKIAYALIKHNMPYSFVDWDGVRDLLSYLYPEYKSITRKTAVVDVWNFYVEQKEKLKRALACCPSRVCLTSDCWTSTTSEGYICLTAHYVDEKWRLNSKILGFSRMEPPHTGVELSNKVYNMLEDWGIEKKVFSITLDNASANDVMQNILKDRLNLRGHLLCNGEFFHIRCSAHILNLIVQEGLKVAACAMHKIRESIRYVKQSEARKKNFDKCIEQVGGIDSSVGLRLDVPTRWNSAYVMIDSALKYRKAFEDLSFDDINFLHCPTAEEWARAESMRLFLEPFAVITNSISGSTYPTSNLYFLQISQIESLLRKNMAHSDPLIRDMAVRMHEKFDKYWHDYSVILSIAIVLDPRFKFDVVKYSYFQLDPSTCDEKVDNIKHKLYSLFNEYKDQESSSSKAFVGHASSSSSLNVSSSTISPSLATIPSSCSFLEGYFSSKTKDSMAIQKSELDFYLEEATLDPILYHTFDVLNYWKTNSARFPCLSKMASDILSIPITTVASESAFSIGSRVLTKYRSCLLPKNVEAIICTRNWLRGFQSEDAILRCGDDEDDEDDVETIPSDIASNIIIDD